MTQEGERVEAYRLNHNSAQAAEIIALTRACEIKIRQKSHHLYG